MFKKNKGKFGYIKRSLRIEFIKALVMILLCVGIYYMGIYSTGSNANVLTFVAILGCLPFAKYFVNFVMLLKAKGCSKELYEELNPVDSNIYYDLFFTTAKKNFQVSALYYKKKCLIMLSEDEKIDVQGLEEHLKGILKASGFENITIKVYLDKDKFIERLKELKELEEDSENLSFLYDNLLSVAL